MKYPQDTYLYKGSKVMNTWIKTDNVESFSPVTQVYGICFNENGEILICRESKKGNWLIPGGHPEKGESIESTLQRELSEEVDVKVKNIKILGVQRVDIPDSPSKTHYQVRCICLIEKLLPQTPDPASGNTWERKLVPADKITEYVKWGVVGEQMFKNAIELEGSGK
jgi:ADP-ribose pyrophosphatase YjhB (NUDIX family)